MQIQLLYFPGCPGWQTTAEHLEALAGHLGFSWETVAVAPEDDAAHLGFRGSPTILVNGMDPFATDDQPFAFACRVYRTPDGFAASPTREQLRLAIEAADS